MDRRRSMYNYSNYSDRNYRVSTPSPYAYIQARSVSREPSLNRTTRSSSVNPSGSTPNTGNFRLHRTSVDRDFVVI